MPMVITTDSCSLGEGRKVEIIIDEMGIWSGLKMKTECRFTGGKQSSRYQAARYIRKMLEGRRIA